MKPFLLLLQPALFRQTIPQLRICAVLLLILLSVLPGRPAAAQTFPAGFSQALVANGLSNPTVLAFAPDGRIFVGEQDGALRVIKNGSLLSAPFVHLNVNSDGERGLIGITLDPDFATNNYLYLYYTVPTAPIHNRISRFTANGDVAGAGSETVVLDLDPLSSASNHNGGAMHFGADGKLYVAVGENANGANAQNLDTYLGKILRLNANGSVPAGNPFVGAGLSAQRQRVWSYGLRNPYTFSIQPGTGRIFLNDVGQNTWEEINDASTGGKNFGWPATEGATTAAGVTTPIFSYAHGAGDGQGCAITGGTFFNPASTNYPVAYGGKYFYQDLCNQWINYIDLSGSTAVRSPFATGLPSNAVGLETGRDGNLYYLSRSAGALYKVVYTAAGSAPVITTPPASATVVPGAAVTFSVTAAGTAPLSYQWQKNGSNLAGATASTYTIASASPASAGAYRVVVSNSVGSTTSPAATLTITAPNTAPTAQILTPAAGTTYVAGTTISFSGEASDAEDGSLPASAFVWRLDLYHDTHVHDGTPFNQGAKTGTFTIPNTGETAATVFYRLRLTVTDAGGLQTTTYRDITPRTSVLSFATVPAGLQLTLDGQPLATPATVTSVEGIRRTLGVVSPQTVGGISYEFGSWSQGGTATQTIATPTDDVTYTATFRPVGTTPAVTTFTLINADTDLPLAGYDPLPGGATLNLATLPTRNLSIRANTSPATVGSVRFDYDGDNNYRLENLVPYALSSDNGVGSNGLPDYLPWTPALGSHTLTATPFAQSGAGGSAGTALTIRFTVTDTPPAGTLRTPENPRNTLVGINYAYYEGRNWTALPEFAALTPGRTGTAADFSLNPRLRDDDFAFRFTGYVRVPADGVYTFSTTSDDGSQLYIGSTLVVNNNGLHGAQERSGQIGLKAGVHAITVTFFERGGEQVLGVSYAGPGLAKTAIPAGALSHGDTSAALRSPDSVPNPVPGLTYSYYEGTWTALPDFTALTPPASGTTGTFSLTPRLRDDLFGFRYMGYVQVPTDGVYTFYTNSDDGSQLYIGSTLVVDNDTEHPAREMAGTIGLQAGLHAITVTFFERYGEQVLDVSYAGPGLNKTSVPALALFHASTPVTQLLARKSDLSPENLQLFPNPARDQVTISLQARAGENVRVEIRDALARRVAGTAYRAAAGWNNIAVALGPLPAGVYTVLVEQGAGRTVRRLVVAP